jgi:hypothetical protein
MTFCERWLGRPDLHLAIDGDRVAADDLAAKMFGEPERERSLAAGCRA